MQERKKNYKRKVQREKDGKDIDRDCVKDIDIID